MLKPNASRKLLKNYKSSLGKVYWVLWWSAQVSPAERGSNDSSCLEGFVTNGCHLSLFLWIALSKRELFHWKPYLLYGVSSRPMTSIMEHKVLALLSQGERTLKGYSRSRLPITISWGQCSSFLIVLLPPLPIPASLLSHKCCYLIHLLQATLRASESVSWGF